MGTEKAVAQIKPRDIAVRQSGRALMEARAEAAIARIKAPEAMAEIIDVPKWIRSILLGQPYREPDPEFISRMLALQTIESETTEELYRANGVLKVQEIVPDEAMAEYGPFEITDYYVASSDFETGNPTYVIISGVMLDTGEEFRCTTGATNIQTTLIALVGLNVWPIRAKFKRGDMKDKGGRFLLFLMPPE
jgi:hypothetical protein